MRTGEGVIWKRDDGLVVPEWWVEAGGRWESPDHRYFFDAGRAQLACDFFPDMLQHTKGQQFAGKPFILDDWQSMLVVRPLFGWKHASTGLRRFRKVRLFIPKKNGKTQLGSGIALHVLYCDGEAGADIICAAADREQAALIFGAAKEMVLASEDLNEMTRALARSLVYGNSSIKVVSADVKTKHGPNIHMLLMDEFHAQEKRDLYETLSFGVAARLQPIDAIFTTAGTDRESICYEEYDYAIGVMKGIKQDETVLPIMFEASLNDDWTSEAVWAKANPNLGKTVTYDYMRGQVAAAINDPRKQNAFKNLHLNIWTQQQTVWIPLEWWDGCERSTLGERAHDGQACGLDLSSKDDLTSFVIVRRIRDVDLAPLEVTLSGAEPGDDEDPELDVEGGASRERRTLNVDFEIEVIPFFWIPEDTLDEHVDRDRVPYDVWRDMGLLRVTDGAIVDYDQMFSDIVHEIAPAYGLRLDSRGRRAPRDPKDHRGTQVGFDPWNIGQLPNALFDAGFLPVEVPQNVQRLSEPSKVLHALTKARRVYHDGHKVMRMCVANVAAKEDKNGNIFPHKPSRTKRVDGVLATIDALSRLIVLPPSKKIGNTGGGFIITAQGVFDADTGRPWQGA